MKKDNELLNLTPSETITLTRRLRDAGFDEKQAETVVRILSGAHLDATLAAIDSKFDRLIWMTGLALVLSAVNFFLLFF